MHLIQSETDKIKKKELELNKNYGFNFKPNSFMFMMKL